MKIPRNATRSLQTSAILNEPILDDNTPVLQPTQKFFAKSLEKIKDCWNRLLDYIPSKPKVVDEALQLFKNQIKKTVQQERHSLPTERDKIWVEKVCDTVSNKWNRLD